MEQSAPFTFHSSRWKQFVDNLHQSGTASNPLHTAATMSIHSHSAAQPGQPCVYDWRGCAAEWLLV